MTLHELLPMTSVFVVQLKADDTARPGADKTTGLTDTTALMR